MKSLLANGTEQRREGGRFRSAGLVTGGEMRRRSIRGPLWVILACRAVARGVLAARTGGSSRGCPPATTLRRILWTNSEGGDPVSTMDAQGTYLKGEEGGRSTGASWPWRGGCGGHGGPQRWQTSARLIPMARGDESGCKKRSRTRWS